MKRKIFIILIFAIFLFVGLTVVFRLHQTNNNSSDGENEKTNLEIKREILLKKIEEMQREKAIEAYIEYGTTDDEVEIDSGTTRNSLSFLDCLWSSPSLV